ncbi:STAS domain-containing protein [Bacillus sp. 31A1R]|uniref:STAS domain-containing protein n=1 Tax=Robertmurraya mangrovi TaxID=3098077 RepID=A0ABU5IVW2_9BACI|nr:STAS domain-containing protein [Bacillus sp. 31A1R]MDZ5471303.1 STAS domain-containing protein [Bacillus sp. 31A1R]
MHRNEELYQFLLDKSWELTENWYQQLDKSEPNGVYSSKDPTVIWNVKQQNNEFHKQFFQVFKMEEEKFFTAFGKWIELVSKDEEHLNTPVQLILREFFRTQEQYLDLISEFYKLNSKNYTQCDMEISFRIVTKTFSKVIVWFTKEYNDFSEERLQSQQALIMELSSPVILLNQNVALLPLVGDIDSTRAKIMLENTLIQCSNLGVSHLLLDLSGVVMIDTMVAHQLFKLIEALNLIGVQTTLSGLRPEIAQTAVQLGIRFDHVKIQSTLSTAISSMNLV